MLIMELHCAEIVIGSGTLKMAGNTILTQPIASSRPISKIDEIKLTTARHNRKENENRTQKN